MTEPVHLEVAESGVATLRLDRPPVNALNADMAQAIAACAARARADDGIRALVVSGGERAFAAGADINEMSALDSVAMLDYIEGFQQAFTEVERLPVVTIAAVSGYALGGGCELALACDLRICARDALWGQPEILLGVIPGAGGTQRLPRLVGVGRAKELIYSGRRVGADEALAIGLVSEVVDAGDVRGRAAEIAARYARGPQLALAAAKRAIQTGIDVDLTTGLALERHAFAALFATEDQKIGMSSFAEQGPGKARFVGR